ncbi:MAG: ribosome biogenesis GTPase Der [Bacteroidales bacterium]|nr:ribosome biogenesis GTPase Der [Bacteroidales bacterium]MDD4603706.1 ribosome biogenesis GTPase Der [Bacteroidales bacterium]
MTNIIAIVGRPNVGKSTLFNRLCGGRDAIVDPTSGVTRDRHYGMGDWNGKQYSVIDTGGYVDNSEDVFEEEIKKQVRLAIDESDVILFLVDAKEGLTPMDVDVADMLRRSKKRVLLVANKVDSYKMVNDIHEFHQLGLGEIYSIASTSGSGTGDLMDEVVRDFQMEELETIKDETLPEEPEIPKIAIVGRPNAGKSSLVNMLLGNDRNIVTPVPGTTRDSIHSHYTYFGLDFELIDTAGIRKKAKVTENIEFYSVMRAIRSIESSNVCILMVDAERGFEAQDLNIFSLIEKNHKGVVILVNKWDLVEKEANTHKDFEASIFEQIAPFRDVPVVFTSVIAKQRIFKAVETAVQVFKNRSRRISTSELNDFILPIIEATPPPVTKGKYVRIKYAQQLHSAFPSFAFFCNHPQYLKESYKRFIENKLREKFNFNGVPIEVYFRQK